METEDDIQARLSALLILLKYAEDEATEMRLPALRAVLEAACVVVEESLEPARPELKLVPTGDEDAEVVRFPTTEGEMPAKRARPRGQATPSPARPPGRRGR